MWGCPTKQETGDQTHTPSLIPVLWTTDSGKDHLSLKYKSCSQATFLRSCACPWGPFPKCTNFYKAPRMQQHWSYLCKMREPSSTYLCPVSWQHRNLPKNFEHQLSRQRSLAFYFIWLYYILLFYSILFHSILFQKLFRHQQTALDVI